MTRVGIGLRLFVQAVAFLIVIGPHWLSLRFGRGRLAAHIPVLFHRLFLRLFSVRVTQSGSPPPPGEPALVLSNHVSWLDIVALGSLRPLSFVAKSEIEGWPLIGTLAKLQRTVFIERAKRAATASVNATVGERLVSGDLIVLFAEGTTGDGLRLLPFRSSLVGAARAALSAETGGLARIRLQPLALAYPRRNGLPVTRAERPEIAWYGDMDLAPHLALFAKRGPIDVHVNWGAPIAFEPATDRKRATAQAEAAVRQGLREIRLGGPTSRPVPAAPEPLGEGADVSAPGIAAV
ncbi:phospholipid/glycerol acyltransferase [Methylorubrum populi BJ001]|jgi:1-acyl-sn-glycerol-3-phosphate acyltransferase|uniref:Phospholipid/glycerol acyltransferase n=1 Tax=Methylorubrum populi (strain ATCC BAA-705 / NCIMB 13946 / BJ001) TaxID=441620 RepID=B1ZJR2_METPB|nr:lysophospholipid acyltransferase family protein [Methylorubrum populi]ACB81548.1 phospholipid/glycerol acyltransferase [Methylorubrum populi BJ001]OAH34761.1 acyl-phosphate glycerol 3-phosphate acyltransferase [Methylorubrum populi]PZP72540.1 MAG: 1-acyl-sn-glycerol-3-phosphate acyltransferase [Methylorubrum populi]